MAEEKSYQKDYKKTKVDYKVFEERLPILHNKLNEEKKSIVIFWGKFFLFDLFWNGEAYA